MMMTTPDLTLIQISAAELFNRNLAYSSASAPTRNCHFVANFYFAEKVIHTRIESSIDGEEVSSLLGPKVLTELGEVKQANCAIAISVQSLPIAGVIFALAEGLAEGGEI